MPREKSTATPMLDGYGGFHAEKSREGVGTAMFAFHYHSRCELVLVTKGHSEVMTYDRRIEMDGAFVVCYPSGMLHMQKNDAALPYERYFVQFPVGILDDLPGQKEYSELISEFFAINVDDETLRMITPWFAALAGSLGNRDDIRIENRRRFLIGLILRQHRTIHGLRLKHASACIFSVILHKKSGSTLKLVGKKRKRACANWKNRLEYSYHNSI